ncbi:polysialyltransferase family glycosyltransferase [Nocardiopsis sp. CC223A]|uniref:polysialyltransferase family glycosyltransferase n=1 Tax=Nocardiopsis sp. CC223A TaxID=3044051 RepID=UPI00278BD10B|nr:polysialyltransferase family glycosyltransferase [Nocardiopsis sp. CC223A]
MTQIFVITKFFGALHLAAAIDSGLFGEQRRVLLTADCSDNPETAPRLDETPGFEAVRSRFDEVISYNDLIWPYHPAHWQAHDTDQALLRRLLGSHLSLGTDVPELIVESVQAHPARALTRLFDDARLTVYSDGLMSYGPTRTTLPRHVATRIERLVHMDLVPGVRPLVLSEHGVGSALVPSEAFRRVVAEVSATTDITPTGEGPSALFVGQYLSSLGLLTEEEETEMSVRTVTACARAGYRSIAYKPHPAHAPSLTRSVQSAAEAAGVRLRLLEGVLPVEAWFERSAPDLVVGCFSTSLSTADKIYGIPVATMGTELVLERLTPYENSNRMPVTIADTTMPRLLDSGEITPPVITEDRYEQGLLPLIRAVGYCMQAAAYPHLREEAAAYLAEYDGDLLRHFKRKRIAALGMTAPGVRPSGQPRDASVPRRLARRARSLLRARPS